MKVQRTSTATNTTENLARWSEIHTTAMSANISYGYTMANTQTVRGVTFPTKDASQNMSCWKHQDVAPAGGVEIDIPHNLKYIPQTIHAQDTTDGGVLYRSAGTGPAGTDKLWTAAKIGVTIDPATGLAVRALLPGHVYLKITSGAGVKYNVIVA